MCGGQQISLMQSEAFESYAKSLQLMGDVGSGQLCKMVNQICIAGVVQGLAEGLNFAKRAGLDAHQVVEVISKGAAQSWQMENRYQTMLANDYDHGFAVQWMRKDLAFALDEAKANGSDLPLTQLVDSFYQQVQEMGGNRWDTSSLLARLEHESQQGLSKIFYMDNKDLKMNAVDKQAEIFNKQLADFIDGSPTPFHAVANMAAYCVRRVFSPLSESEDWTVKQGEKYFVTRNGSSIIAFVAGSEDLG